MRNGNSLLPPIRIAGIPVEINYSWLLIFVLVSANLAFGWYPDVLPDRPSFHYYILGIGSCISLFLCVLAHELSHSFAAKHEGLPVHGIILHVFGGVSMIGEERYSPRLEFKIALAGPLLSVFLAAAFWALRRFVFPSPATAAHELLTYLYLINISLAVFNLVPAFPLDGGRILRSVLAAWMKDLVAATRWASRAGVFTALLLMGYGLLALFSGNFWGFWSILIGIFLKDAAETSFRQTVMRDAFRDQSVSEIMQREPVIVPPDITVQQLIDNFFWRFHHGSFPVGDCEASDQPCPYGTKALGIVTFKKVRKVAPDQRMELFVRNVMEPLREDMIIASSDRIVVALDRASTNDVGRLIVADSDCRIVGYLSLRDIATAFRIRSESDRPAK